MWDLFCNVHQVVESSDGYALRLAWNEEFAAKLISFITTERRCCPFLKFELSLEPGDGPAWLTIRGPEGTKEFVKDWIPH